MSLFFGNPNPRTADDIPADPEQSVPQEQQPPPLLSPPVVNEVPGPSHGAEFFDPQKIKADEILAKLLEAGFDENTANLAIRRTDYKGIEEAIEWITERTNESDLESEADDSDEEVIERARQSGLDPTELQELIANMATAKSARTHKMVFVANMGIKMGTGKIAAQVGHACLGLYKKAMSTPEGQTGIESWTKLGQVKIVVKGDSTEQLMDLFKEAKDKGLFAYLVVDAGYTQIPPGSRTVLGIFGPRDLVDSVTGQLRLL